MSESLREEVRGDGRLRIVRRDGTVTINNVKLLAEHGNDDYPPATRKKAARLLEGMLVHIDHPASTADALRRSYRDAMGFVHQIEEGKDCLRGSWSFSEDHPLARQVIWDATHCAGGLGFSIIGRGVKRPMNGRKVVEDIEGITSIDIVRYPGHRGGLFEGRTMMTTVHELSRRLQLAGHHRHSRVLREAADSGVMPPDTEVDTEVPGVNSDAGDADQAVVDAMEAAWTAVYRDESLDTEGKLRRAREILRSVDKLTGRNGSAEEGRRGRGLRESGPVPAGRAARLAWLRE